MQEGDPFDLFERLPSLDVSSLRQLDEIMTTSGTDEKTVTQQEPNELFQPFEHLSKAAKELTGKHIPDNTAKSNNTSLRGFCIFVVRYLKLMSPEKITSIDTAHPSSNEHKSLATQCIGLVRLYLFRDEHGNLLPNGYNDWKDEELSRINNAVVEWVANYKTKNGQDITPETLKAYINGLSRAFRETWQFNLDLLRGPIFGVGENSVYNVVDNKMREQQGLGVAARSHNVLSEEDILTLYKSSGLTKSTPRGFITRMIFNVAFVTGFRPSELLHLSWKSVYKMSCGANDVWRIVGTIGSKKGSSKTQRGGIRYANVRPKEILVWNRCHLGGLVNVHEDLSEYASLVKPLLSGKPDLRFFVSANHLATTKAKFFKAVNLGRNSLQNYVKSACVDLGIVGIGLRNGITPHGLRGTVITRLFEQGHADSSVALRSGHRDMRSLKAYQNLRGKLGRQQQDDIFGLSGHRDSKPTVTIDEEEKENDAGFSNVESLPSGLGILCGVKSIGGNVTIQVNNYGSLTNSSKDWRDSKAAEDQETEAPKYID